MEVVAFKNGFVMIFQTEEELKVTIANLQVLMAGKLDGSLPSAEKAYALYSVFNTRGEEGRVHWRNRVYAMEDLGPYLVQIANEGKI